MKYVFAALPGLLLLVGVVVVALCAQRLLHRQQLQSDGSTISGTVKWATTTSARSNQIQVSYFDATGKGWIKDFPVFSSQYRAGQSVDVVYLPANPQVAVLGPMEAGVTGTQEAVGVAVGGLAVLIGGGWLFVVRLSRRP